IGLTHEGQRLQESPRRAQLAQVALRLMAQPLAQRPDDLVALRARALALAMTGRAKEGLRVLDEVLKRSPDYEHALNERVALALELNNQRTDLPLALHAVSLNPWTAEFHEWLAYYQLENGDWNAAHQESGEALRLNPFLTSARRFR